MRSSRSFAGGKNDRSDRDVVATALRETREELGITVAPQRVWGTLKPLRDAVSLRWLLDAAPSSGLTALCSLPSLR